VEDVLIVKVRGIQVSLEQALAEAMEFAGRLRCTVQVPAYRGPLGRISRDGRVQERQPGNPLRRKPGDFLADVSTEREACERETDPALANTPNARPLSVSPRVISGTTHVAVSDRAATWSRQSSASLSRPGMSTKTGRERFFRPGTEPLLLVSINPTCYKARSDGVPAQISRQIFLRHTRRNCAGKRSCDRRSPNRVGIAKGEEAGCAWT